MTPAETREVFVAASDGFVAVAAEIGADAWGRPGLGVWSVRDLVGHASRSLTTIETYLAAAADDPPDEIEIRDPLDYLLALRSFSMDPVAVAQRGRDAGAALGDDPGAAVKDLAARVTALVATTPDNAPVRTIFRAATLLAYLPTRTFELTVHTLDLVAALGVAAPSVLEAPIAASLQLAAAAAGRGGDAGAVLLALTGRRPLPNGFSVV